MYGLGAVMGLSPKQVDELTLWEFSATCFYYSRIKNPDQKVDAPSADEYYAAMAKFGIKHDSGE